MRLSMRVILLVGFVLGFLVSNATLAAESVVTTANLYYPMLNTVDGNLHGKVTVVEFFDYRCSFCRRVPALLTALIKTNSNIRIVYRDYPALGQASILAAQAALAAQPYGKYLALHATLLASNQPLNKTNIVQLGERQGLNSEEIKRGMVSNLVQQQLQENISMAKSLGITGVPAFIIAMTPAMTEQQPINAYLLVSPSLVELQAVVAQLEKNG